MKKYNILIILIIFLLLTGCSNKFLGNSAITNKNDLRTEEAECLVKNKDDKELNDDFKQIDVVEIYKDQYTISIKEGNFSICLWRYSAGNANIPYLETTKAKSSSEKHSISIIGPIWDENVYCFDDWGGKYIGVNKDSLSSFAGK